MQPQSQQVLFLETISSLLQHIKHGLSLARPSKHSSIMGSIFWCSLKRRRMARNNGDSDLKDTEYSTPGLDDVVPDIFLSHSGKQKSFVERLYDELERTNHTVFFDQHSLPKGSRFPPHIKQAARGCKLGLIVLSEEFLTSKWPMIELEILVSQRKMLLSQGSDLELHVLPLFFRLSPDDLKSPIKLSKWRKEWEKLGGADCAKQWEQAVKDLRPFNGEVYVQGTSEGAYIKKVVQRICTLVPSRVYYDCSSIQGRSRLAQEIASKFELLDASGAGKVGLHGVGGSGKTTLCEVMVNHYSPQFCGRSFLLDFPSPGSGDMRTVVLQCKKALDKLTDASDKYLLSDIDHFNQVVQLMKGRMGRHGVFLAVDNVWEKYLEEAKRVLRVGFSVKSKILVTSRSEEVLKDVLGGPVSNAVVGPLPNLKREEAFHIFQHTFEQDNLDNLFDREQIEEVLGRCRFEGSYHALALKALANYVKRACMGANSKEGIKHQFSCVLKEISSKDLSEVDEVIRLSYDSLPEPKQLMFLDIAVVLSWFCKPNYLLGVPQELVVSMLNWQSPGSQIITKLMNDLSLDGLIRIKRRWNWNKIELHDLYYEFAVREIARSPRFWVDGITNVSVEKIEAEKLAIVVLEGGKLGLGLFEKLQQSAFPKLRMLKAARLGTRSGIRVTSMSSLCVLILHDITLVKNECQKTPTSSGSLSEKDSGSGSEEIVLHGLVELQVLKVSNIEYVEKLAGLDALNNLRRLEVRQCRRLRSLDGLSGLMQLQVMYVNDCESLGNLPDMRHLTRLNLKRMETDCAIVIGSTVHKLPNLLTGLEELNIWGGGGDRLSARLMWGVLGWVHIGAAEKWVSGMLFQVEVSQYSHFRRPYVHI